MGVTVLPAIRTQIQIPLLKILEVWQEGLARKKQKEQLTELADVLERGVVSPEGGIRGPVVKGQISRRTPVTQEDLIQMLLKMSPRAREAGFKLLGSRLEPERRDDQG